MYSLFVLYQTYTQENEEGNFFMVALYFAAFAFSVLLLILTLAATSQYRGNYHVLSTMTTAIVNFGYWQLAMSHNLEEAL